MCRTRVQVYLISYVQSLLIYMYTLYLLKNDLSRLTNPKKKKQKKATFMKKHFRCIIQLIYYFNLKNPRAKPN